MPFTKYVISKIALDVFLRLFLFTIYGVFQIIPPFKRVIHAEEAWLYKNPVTQSYCPMNVVWEIAIVIPSALIFANYIVKKDVNDVIQAFLAFSLTLCLNGAVTNVFKVIVGRPRPDFYYRCFPNGVGNLEVDECTGNIHIINDGRKSFPSGHSSVAFASLGFLSLYYAGKMHLFSARGKGSTWKLLVFLFPLFTASMIAASRTCDYHHHWEDVVVGAVLGFSICWICYHHYYPSLQSERSHIPRVDYRANSYNETVSVKEV